MKQTINEYDFIDGFRTRSDQFSRDALRALFAHYEELEQSTGEELEFDPIGICCDWSEYATAEEAALEYGWERPADGDDEKADVTERKALEWLQDNTQVLETEKSVVVMGF